MLFKALESFRQSIVGRSIRSRRRRAQEHWVASEQLERRDLLSGLSFFQKFQGIDWTSGGVGGVGNFGGGVANVSPGPVNGAIAHAYLYWQGIDRGFGPSGSTDGIYDNETVTFEGVSVTGTSLGIGSSATSSSLSKSQAFRADVTHLVRSGTHSYSVTGLASKPGHDANGVSLVIIYQDGNASNDRDLYILNGNHVNAGHGNDGDLSATLSGFIGGSGDVRAQLHVADGQSYEDAAIQFTSSTGGSAEITDDMSLFDGVSVPSMGHSRVSNGSLWDVQTFNLGPFATAGSQTLSFRQDSGTFDALGLVALLIDTSSTPPNTPPVAFDDTFNGSEDTALSGHLSASDADGDTLTYAIVTPPSEGHLVLDAATGNFTYTPPINFYGDVEFTYRVWDPESPSSVATVRMSFAPVNDAPVVSPLEVSLGEDTSIDGQIEAHDVVDAILSYLLIDGPKHGSLQLGTDGSFHYTPHANWNGDDSFTVAVSDGTADAVLTVVPVHVTPVNDAPTVAAGNLVVPINAKNGDAIGVVAAHDVDGDVLTYAIIAGNDGAFDIDARTGTITLRDAALLRKGGPRDVVLMVSVTDPSGEVGVARIVVKVEMPSVKMRLGFKQDASVSLHGSPWSPLVIYGSGSLNVRDIDLKSLTFGRTGHESSIKGFGKPLHVFRDVDRDGKLDLVLLVDLRKTGLKAGDTSVSLKGTLKNGTSLGGTSSVTVVQAKGHSKGKCVPHKSHPASHVKKK